MKKIAYITPHVRVKNVAPISLMQGSLNPNNPITGLDDPIGDGGDDPGDFAKKNGSNDIWED